jgi:hypothetical protein
LINGECKGNEPAEQQEAHPIPAATKFVFGARVAGPAVYSAQAFLVSGECQGQVRSHFVTFKNDPQKEIAWLSSISVSA